MKYIIDDTQLEALTKGESCSLTQVPELPVKPWYERDCGNANRIELMRDEITELRTLCQAQAVEISTWKSAAYNWEMSATEWRATAEKYMPTPPNPAFSTSSDSNQQQQP